jgi:hypothetical protein
MCLFYSVYPYLHNETFSPEKRTIQRSESQHWTSQQWTPEHLKTQLIQVRQNMSPLLTNARSSTDKNANLVLGALGHLRACSFDEIIH